MPQQILKRNLEPFGVTFRMLLDVAFKLGKAHVFPRCDFFIINNRCVVAVSDDDMVEFMLGETLPDRCLIDKGIGLFHVAFHAHFFHQSSACGFFDGFVFAWMAATGVGPKARGVVFREGALLHEQFAFAVEDKNGKSAMEMWRDVRLHLLHQSDLLVAFVN